MAPLIHSEGFVGWELTLPIAPLAVPGGRDAPNVFRIGTKACAPRLLSVKVTVLLVQTVSFGDTVKLTTGDSETRIRLMARARIAWIGDPKRWRTPTHGT